MTNFRFNLVPALITAITLLTVGCTNKIDHTKVEESITQGLKEKNVTLKSVSCPADHAVKAGDNFDCTGVDEGGEHLVFTVTQKDDSGNISWNLDGMIIDQSKIGDSIEANVGKAADVKCPAKTVILKPSQSFTCPVIVEGATHNVLITLTDKEGNVTWKIQG